MTARQIALLLTASFLWGAVYVFTSLALEGFDPFVLVCIRMAIAGLALAVALHVWGGGIGAARRLLRERPWLCLLLALTASAAPFSLTAFGQRHVPAGTTAVLISSVPLWTAVLGVWLDRAETLGQRQAVGLVVGLAGVALVVGVEAIHTAEELAGAALILVGAGFVALGNLVAMRHFSDVAPLPRALITSALASILLTPGAAATAGAELTARSLVGLIGLSLPSTALLLVLMFRLIDAVGPRRTALTAYLAPAFALVQAAVVLGDPIGAGALAGLVLIVAGVVLASRPAPQPVPALSASG
jgi:drug/metabolite transporter (DMT)-like permease